MATLIPCTVDTSPMAEELQSVSNHVKGTTAAVVTMQAAVIAAENEGANKVCSNVNRGFFTLMRSQISQKIANKQSRVEALLLHLGQQRRQLLSIKANMEREYGRISARYLRIFTSVNKELESRVMQIDQPVFELVNKHMATSSNRMNALSGWVTTSQSEGLTQGQKILVSSMKHNAQVALEQTTEFLEQIGEQRVLAGKVLISSAAGNEDKTCQVPVLICETASDPSGTARMDVWTPDALPKANADQINNAVRSAENLPWGDHASEQPDRVTEEFNRLLQASQADERVKKMITKLFQGAAYQTL